MPPTTDRRQFLKGAAAVGAATVLPATKATAGGRRSATADLLVVGGSVLTMDRRHPRTEAVAVGDGKILAVGRTRELRRLATRSTEVIDARGATVLPGINDSHLHISSYSLNLPPLSADVDTATIEQLVAAVRDAAAAAGPAASWIRGRG